MKWQFLNALARISNPAIDKMEVKDVSQDKVLDFHSLLKMPQWEFLKFLMDYNFKTKFGAAPIELYKAGRYEEAEIVSTQWINICDALLHREIGIFPKSSAQRFKYLHLGCLANINLYRADYD